MSRSPTKSTTNPAGKGVADDRSSRSRATKGDCLVQLLKARAGKDIATLSTELGWQPHTTRAALSRLRKAGYAVERLPRSEAGGARYRIAKVVAKPAP